MITSAAAALLTILSAWATSSRVVQYTPLCAAAQAKNVATVRVLLEKGESPNQRCETYSPLSFAIFYNSKEIAELLLSRQADPNIHFSDGLTPLEMAVLNRNI